MNIAKLYSRVVSSQTERDKDNVLGDKNVILDYIKSLLIRNKALNSSKTQIFLPNMCIDLSFSRISSNAALVEQKHNFSFFSSQDSEPLVILEDQQRPSETTENNAVNVSKFDRVGGYFCSDTFSNLRKKFLIECDIGSRAVATSKIERFVIIVNSWKPLTIIAKYSILDAASALDPPLNVSEK